MDTSSETRTLKSVLSDILQIAQTNLAVERVKVGPPFASVEFKPDDNDISAAWDMYVELLTRIATQPLDPDKGDEEAALQSIYSLFGTTRGILKEKGRTAKEFTRISIVILNAILRPFTSKWHKKKEDGAFADETLCKQFRDELETIRKALCAYAVLLADMAHVEDLTQLLEYRHTDSDGAD